MKVRGVMLLTGIIIFIVALGLLRYYSWNSSRVNGTTLTVGYLPVTCHLTCPVTDFTSKTTQSNTKFNSKIFTDFPTVASALQSKQIEATFMLVPLAMKLREQGVPVKICYLGHRDGSEIIVAKNSKFQTLKDLKGKKMAIPSLYSNQYLVINKLMTDQGLKPGDITFIILPPPDLPVSLAAGAIDSYFVGEPFCAKAELDGVGRVLYYARDIWPNFISCALVVHEDLIKDHPEIVSDLVRGIAQSGVWAESHRAEAAKLVAPYYRQNEKVLNYVLTSSPHRVSYIQLTPSDQDMQQIGDMAVKMGLLKKKINLKELIDLDFIPKVSNPSLIDPVKPLVSK